MTANTRATQLNTEGRTVQLCRWTYGDIPNALRVDIFVDLRPVKNGAGFAVAVCMQAFAYRFAERVSDGFGGDKDIWENMHVEQFIDCDQLVVQSWVAQGLDPLFEMFKANEKTKTTLHARFPALATAYERIEIEDTTPNVPRKSEDNG